MGSVKHIFSARVRFGRSRSSKVIDLGTNHKRVCDFLLVPHSNPHAIWHRFRDIAVFCAHDPPRFHPTFGGLPPDGPCWGVNPSMSLMLISRESIFEVFQPMSSRCLKVTDGQTADIWLSVAFGEQSCA